jgi:hypothetical protein
MSERSTDVLPITTEGSIPYTNADVAAEDFSNRIVAMIEAQRAVYNLRD